MVRLYRQNGRATTRTIGRNHYSCSGYPSWRVCRESRERSIPVSERERTRRDHSQTKGECVSGWQALTRLVEDQVTTAARVRCLRIYRGKRQSQTFWRTATRCIPRRKAPVFWPFRQRL